MKAQLQGTPIHCGIMQNLEMLKAQDPTLEARMQEIEQRIQQYITTHPNERMKSIITVPVVFHVVYNTLDQNIDDSLITSQIDILNEDYNAANSDLVKVPPYYRSRIGNVALHFALATRDPNGNATNGIVRKQTSVTSFYSDNKVKYDSTGGDNAWNNQEYLNVWICNLSGGLLGYSQFPGGPAATDGCVILYNAAGRISAGAPYNYGRTLSHEIGHWVYLRHTWGDAYCGNDSVSDTPTQMTATIGPQDCQRITCGNDPIGDPYMDYMDYTDDQFMFLFTQGQVARMTAAFNTYRASIPNSNGLNIVSTAPNDAGIGAILSPVMTPCINVTQDFAPQVTLTNYGSNTLTSVTINSRIDFNSTKTYQWSGSLAAGASATITLPEDTSTITGDHIYYCWTSNPNGMTDGNTVNDRRTSSFIIKEPNTNFPVSMDFESPTFPPSNWSIKNYDCTVSWQRTTTAFHTGTACAVMQNFDDTTTVASHLEDLITEPINLAGNTTPTLYFWVAYSPLSTAVTDTLEVLMSTDCESSFTSIYKKWGGALQTVPPQVTAFVPNPFQWRLDSINLAPYFPASNAIFIFRNISDKGNNLYLDDLNILPTGTNPIVYDEQVYLFPNPALGILNIGCRISDSEQVQITIYNVIGQLIYQSITNDQLFQIDLSHEAKGVYIIQLKTTTNTVVKKLVLE